MLTNTLRAFLCCLMLAGLCLFSCEPYEPEGDYFKEIELQEPEQLWVKLGPGTDTLILRKNAFISFDILPGGQQEGGYQLYLGERLIRESKDPLTFIDLQDHFFQDGYYKLFLKLFVKSNTGSMADKMGAEHYGYHFNWTLKIDSRPHTDYPIHAFKVGEERGRVKLSWPRYDLPAFGSYEIHRREEGEHSSLKRILIEDPRTTVYYDDAFVGGNFTYSLHLNRHEWPATSSSKPVAFSTPYAQLRRQERRGEQFYVEWSSCRLPKNFVAYEIYRNNSCCEENLVYRSTRVQDTTTLLTTPFGEQGYILVTRGSDEREFMEGPASSFSITNGQPHQLPSLPHYLAGENALLLAGEEGLFSKLDAASLEPLLSRQHSSGYGLTVSDNGKYIYYCAGSELIRLDPASLDVLARFPLESLIGYTNRPAQLSVNNSNQLLMNAYQLNGRVDSLSLLDMNSGRLLARMFEAMIISGKLSNDGRYFVQEDGYALPLFPGGDGWEFRTPGMLLPGSANQLLSADWDKLQVFELETMQLLREFPVPGLLHHLSVDPLTGHAGGLLYREGHSYFQLYDTQTGELLRELEVNTNNPLRLINHMLFAGDLYLPL